MRNGHVLVVEDDPVSRRLLVRILEAQGYAATPVANGNDALDLLYREHPRTFDVVILDIVNSELDGYGTLRAIKDHPDLRDLPVLMISAVSEIDSVIECIKLGAADYLPKPFNAELLRARLSSSLTAKRLRDLELEYLEQVRLLTSAASAVEAGTYEAALITDVAERPDELGQLARVFQAMVREVRAREERLVQQVQVLQIEIDEARQAQRVAEITESEFYQKLTAEADELRSMFAGRDAPESRE